MAENKTPSERRSTGIAGLDRILEGGLLSAGVYIVQGPPGAGKTILANQACFHHASTGGRAVYVTLLAEAHSRMFAHLRRMAFFDEAAIGDRSEEHTSELQSLAYLVCRLLLEKKKKKKKNNKKRYKHNRRQQH